MGVPIIEPAMDDGGSSRPTEFRLAFVRLRGDGVGASGTLEKLGVARERGMTCSGTLEAGAAGGGTMAGAGATCRGGAAISSSSSMSSSLVNKAFLRLSSSR